jgi:hypothetical protein
VKRILLAIGAVLGPQRVRGRAPRRRRVSRSYQRVEAVQEEDGGGAAGHELQQLREEVAGGVLRIELRLRGLLMSGKFFLLHE